jgi:hypothetical protein
MQQIELIERVPESCEEIVFDNLSADQC